jgi:glycosyltransferase involved in cell wall biosynthesis
MHISGRKRLNNKILNYTLLYLAAIPSMFRADFIYVFYPNSFKYVLLFAKLFGKKYGLYIRGEMGIKNRYSNFIYKSAYSINTVSDQFTEYIDKAAHRNVTYTIKPMIQFEFNDIKTDRQYKNKNSYQLLYLGRLSFDKGLEELILAMSVLIERKRIVFLKIVGTGDFITELKDLTIKLNLNNFISFEGAVYDSNRIRQYYKNADIFVLPTYHEGFPRTLYEAMIFGTPIITTFVGGIPGLMKNNINAFEIQPKSIDSIVDRIENLISAYSESVVPIARNATKLISDLFRLNKLSHAENLSFRLNLINK